jgi:hypothetical protein
LASDPGCEAKANGTRQQNAPHWNEAPPAEEGEAFRMRLLRQSSMSNMPASMSNMPGAHAAAGVPASTRQSSVWKDGRHIRSTSNSARAELPRVLHARAAELEAECAEKNEGQTEARPIVSQRRASQGHK